MAQRDRKTRKVKVALSTNQGASEPSRQLPWPLTAMVGAALVALAGWLLITGAVAIGWAGATGEGFSSALLVGTQLWLLANGGVGVLGESTITVVPLGVTVLIVLLATGAAGFAAQRVSVDDQPVGTLTWRIVGTFAATYVGCLAVPAVAVGNTAHLGRLVLAAALIAGGSAFVAVARAFHYDVRETWPGWAKALPQAVSAALLIVLIAAGCALASALLLAKDRVVSLHDALSPGIAGGVLLLVLQLAYLPNFLAWCASWALGAGFTLGVGTVVSPTDNQLGLLPSLPVFAAVPPAGPGSWPMLWWLASGVLAGAAAALIVVRSRPRARFDETALVGGLSGVVAGLLIVAVCALANGALGAGRLSEIGARLGLLVVLAPTLLGVSGLIAGLTLGLWWRRGTRELARDLDAASDEPTTPVASGLDGAADETSRLKLP